MVRRTSKLCGLQLDPRPPAPSNAAHFAQHPQERAHSSKLSIGVDKRLPADGDSEPSRRSISPASSRSCRSGEPDNSITSALTILASAGVGDVDLHVDPHVCGGKNHHCGCKHTKKNEKSFDRNKPMEHRILEMSDEDGHAVTVIGNNVLRFRHRCPRIGADGRQQDEPRPQACKRAGDEEDKQQLPK